MTKYIKLEELMKFPIRRNHYNKVHGNDFVSGIEMVLEYAKNIPAADVAPVRHGCWERVIPSKSAAKWSTKVSCSNCHNAGYAHHKYCPNCGAKMDGELNE